MNKRLELQELKIIDCKYVIISLKIIYYDYTNYCLEIVIIII
jgi:hypothetical protein